MNLEERIEKYKQNSVFKLTENLRYLSEKYRYLEVPFIFGGALTGLYLLNFSESDSKIIQEINSDVLNFWKLSLISTIGLSGFFGKETYLKNASKNFMSSLVCFSLGTSCAYYNSTLQNLGNMKILFNSLLVGGTSYYLNEVVRSVLNATKSSNPFDVIKSFIKKDDSLMKVNSKFQEEVKKHNVREDFLKSISNIFNLINNERGFTESLKQFSRRFSYLDNHGNVLSSYNIQKFHQEKRYSKLFSEMDKLKGFEPEEILLTKAIYIDQVCNHKNMNIPEFLKLEANIQKISWEKVWDTHKFKIRLNNLGGLGVYEVSEDFSKFLQQQIVFKTGCVKREIELIKQAKLIFSDYSQFSVVNINYFCDEGMILGRENGIEGWDVEKKSDLKLYGKGIAILQNKLIKNGLVLDLDCHPGNVYFGNQIVFADISGKDYRSDVVDIVKATQTKGRSENLISSWLNERNHEMSYGKKVLQYMVEFPEICEKKDLRGKQASEELVRLRYVKAMWAKNQLA